MNKQYRGIVGSLLLGLLTACASPAPAPPPPLAQAVDLVTAMRSFSQADSRQSLLTAIRQLESHAATHPDSYKSRAKLANAYTLLGVGYSNDIPSKQAAYAAAIRYAEAALLTEPGFAHVWKKRGVSFTLALQQLDHRHLEAMEHLKLALLLDYLECSGPMGRLLSPTSLQRALAIMDRIDQIDPNALGGNNRFSRGLYLFSQPAMLGGDEQAGRALIHSAVRDNPRNLLPRWGRAKYMALPADQRTLLRRDLKWMVEQPLKEMAGHRAWNVMMQRQAAELLYQSREPFKN